MSDSIVLLYICVAGWLATDLWRWLGVLIGNRLKEHSLTLIWVRSIATALVAAVIAKLILTDSGALAETPYWLRMLAIFSGFVLFSYTKKNVAIGVLVSLTILILGQILLM